MAENTQKTYLEDLFSSEVMRWRYGKSLLVSLLFQVTVSTICCNLFRLIFIEYVWNPLYLISAALNGVVHPVWLWNFPMQAICIVILIRIHIHSYSTYWWIPERRLKFITESLQPKKLINSLFMVLISCLLIRQYAHQIQPEFSYLTLDCIGKPQKLCINHEAGILMFAGFIFGIKLACRYYVGNYRTIKFLPCQPSHLTQIKDKLSLRCIVESCSLYDVGFWTVLATLGSYLFLAATNLTNTLMMVPETPEASYLDHFSQLLGFQLILSLIFCLILLSYNIHCFFLTFNQFVTQSIEIPVCMEDSPMVTSQSDQSANVWKLSNALVSSSNLLQLLGFKHFKDFSSDKTSWGTYYRTQVFAISQPGGHAHNWQGILNPSLNLIRKFIEKLRVNNCLDAPPTVTKITTDVNKNEAPKTPFNPTAKLKSIMESLKQYPLFCYLLSDLHDAKNRQIFAEAQPIIWAIQGLSNIVAASYHDDQYGVVQRNVADILSALTQLQQVVEKVGRGGVPTRKCGSGTNFGTQAYLSHHDIQLRKALRLVIRSSIYTITSTFKDSIRDVNMNNEVRTKLDSYLAFQEG